MSMPLDKPVEIESIFYRTRHYKGKEYINEISLKYTNGHFSPVISKTKAFPEGSIISERKTIKFSDIKHIRKVEGT